MKEGGGDDDNNDGDNENDDDNYDYNNDDSNDDVETFILVERDRIFRKLDSLFQQLLSTG